MSLMLLDTASLYFRAFYGVPRSVKAPDGTPVNAVRGMLDMIAFLLDRRRPARLVACWDDDWRPAFRVRAIPSYKAHRVGQGGAGADDSPPELAVQVPVIVEVLAALGIARLGAPGYEADDVIGTLVQRNARPGGPPVDVVTGDRDLFQLVDDACAVRVLYTAKGVRDAPAGGRGLAAREVRGALRLRIRRSGRAARRPQRRVARGAGDRREDRRRVAGRASETWPACSQAVADPRSGLSGGQRRRLLEAADYLAVAPAVVRVARDAPIPGVDDVDDAVPAEPADPDAVLALAERWGLSSSLSRLVQAL